MKEKKVPIQFYVTPRMKYLIKEEALRRRMTISATAVMLYEKWLKIKKA